MSSNLSSIAFRATQMVKTGVAPVATAEIKPGKESILEVFEDVFQQVPLGDNGPADKNPEKGKVNFRFNAPHGMNDWDFEYTDDTLVRTGGEHRTEFSKENGQIRMLSASDRGITSLVYDAEAGTTAEQNWNILGAGNPTTLTLLPEEPPKKIQITGSPEVVAEKKRMLGEMLKKLKAGRGE